jgi:hypothetical protein
MLEIREHAELLAWRIKYGFIDSQVAIDWACKHVIAEQSPSEQMLELAGLIRPDPLDVVSALRRIPGVLNNRRLFRRILGVMRETLQCEPELFPRITSALEQMCLHGEVPEEFASECFMFDDSRLLAEQGIFDLNKVRQDLIDYLNAQAEASDI